MRKQSSKSEPISLLFIVSVLGFILFLIFYISYPNKLDATKGKKTFEELLEYNIKTPKDQKKIDNSSFEDKKSDNIGKVEENNDYKENHDIDDEKSVEKNVYLHKNYNQLLDELAEYPSQSEFFITNITNKLLEYKGYPENTLKINISDIDSLASKSMNSFMLANFNFLTGELNVNKRLLYEYDINTIIAVLAHELDHFDKFAKICKSVGIEEFNKIFTDNEIYSLDTVFWSKVADIANTDNFNSPYYTSALKRFLDQKSIEKVSSYADFYILAENIRNPLEVSAYKASDYVYDYFQIPVQNGDMKKLAKIFDEIDLNIDKIINEFPILKQERTAIFDYFYAHAIIDKMSEFSNEFKYCDTNKNGDLTSFWLEFETKYSSFYKHSKITMKTRDDIFMILNATKERAKNGITKNELAKSLHYKINTLKSNLVYKGSLNNLRTTIINYLKFIKNENIENVQKQEFEAILLLICIDNQIFKSTINKEISLYDIKIPDDLIQLYELKNKNRKFLFIYNNSEFTNLTASIEGNENEKLTNLLNDMRLDVKVP